MKRVRFVADLFTDDEVPILRDVDRALYWGWQHQDYYLGVVSIEDIEELPEEDD